MTEQTRFDIADASSVDEICIQLLAIAKSPYEDYIHETNPCIKGRLIRKGWLEVTPQEYQEYKTRNRLI